MPLAWTSIESYRAETKEGKVYLIMKNWQKGKDQKPYIAVLSYIDERSRVFEHVVGVFDTVAQAKAECENDSKDG